MSIGIRAIGAVILLCASLFIGRAYERYLNRRLESARELLRMLSHIRDKINAFLCPQGELLSDFESEALESVGFIKKIRGGAGLSEAYRASSFSFSEEMRRALDSYFADFGKRYKADELARLDIVRGMLEKYVNDEEARTPKDIKIAKTLIGAMALGVSILMI